MSALEEISIVLKGIGTVLKEQNSYIPRYQRSYAWKDDNVLALYQDIGNAISADAKEYFLGSIVISQRIENKPEIVDGQQRLATICILLAAIRDYFQQNGDPDRADWVANEFLAKKDLESLELIPKLHLNDSDHEFFVNRVIADTSNSSKTATPTKESHHRISAAAEAARKIVGNVAAITNNPSQQLIQWIKYITERAKVIAVRVPDEANAFVIFETLNDRGLELAVSDLLKNHLFFRAENRIDEVQHNWIQMLTRIESAESEQAVVTFIRYLWSSKNGITREKELFNRIKSGVTSKAVATNFSNELNEASVIYAAIVTCDAEFWSKYPPSSRLCMETLNFFNIVQLRPLLIAVLSKFGPTEVDIVMRSLVNWSVRFLIVGGLGGGALETKYCECAMKVHSGDITKAAEIINFMLSSVPSDSEFSNAFQTATVSKNYLARYYLRAMEQTAQGGKELEFLPNPSQDDITLEHILPENPSNAWGYIPEEDAKAHFKRLGNCALLKKSLNSDIGNKGFAAKKPFYEESQYKLTKSLNKYDSWGLSEIETRQKELAEIAVQTWPLKA